MLRWSFQGGRMTTHTKLRDLHSGHRRWARSAAPARRRRRGSVDALVRGMAATAFGGRNLGEAADVFEAMVRDRDCFRVLTISGAMTIAKQGLVVCEMIDRGWVHAIVATGALMTHGFVEAAGMTHYKHRPSMNDEELFAKGYNRVYDTLELEQNSRRHRKDRLRRPRRRPGRHAAVQPRHHRSARRHLARTPTGARS